MKRFRQILEGVDPIMEAVSTSAKELAKEIDDAARRETGQDKKDYMNVAKLIGANKYKEAAKAMSDLDTAPLEDLITFIMGHEDVFNVMYPKARPGQSVARFARESVEEASSTSPNMAKAVQGLNDLGYKLKGRDGKDVQRVEKLFRSGNKKVLQGAIRALDTDIRDQIMDVLEPLGFVKNGVVESLDEAAVKVIPEKLPRMNRDEKDIADTLTKAGLVYGKVSKFDSGKFIDPKTGVSITIMRNGNAVAASSADGGTLLPPTDARNLKAFLKKRGLIESIDEAGYKVPSKYTSFSTQNKGRKPSLGQSKLSSAEYQKAKKLKGFNADDWKWNGDLYIRVNESVKEDVDLEEGKMKEFHDMVKKGMTAEQIAKKIGFPVKDVADFMKGMKEAAAEDKWKGKMKRFREVLEGTVVEAKDWYSFNTKKLATDFAKAVKDKNADDGDLDKWLDGFAKKSGIKPNDRKMDQDIANDIVFDLAKMGYKKIDAYDLNTFEVDESVKEGTLPPALQAYQDKKNGKKPKDDEKEVEEAMSPADKAKRLKMIRQAVEKINKGNAELAKKDALKMMKDSGMFDESVTEAMETWTVTVEEAMSPADKAKRLKMIRQAVEKINKGNAELAKKDALKMMKDSGMFDEELEEDVADWVVTVAKPVNKLKKGDEQKVKARSAFEAINKAMKLWGDPALKAAPMNSFSIQKEGFRPVPMFEDMSIETFAKFYS
jgi:hypothetical protein